MRLEVDCHRWRRLHVQRLTIFLVSTDVDEAVAEARTGGRGVSGNGFISSALAQEHKKDETS
jgi:hypothetical protein